MKCVEKLASLYRCGVFFNGNGYHLQTTPVISAWFNLWIAIQALEISLLDR